MNKQEKSSLPYVLPMLDPVHQVESRWIQRFGKCKSSHKHEERDLRTTCCLPPLTNAKIRFDKKISLGFSFSKAPTLLKKRRWRDIIWNLSNQMNFFLSMNKIPQTNNARKIHTPSPNTMEPEVYHPIWIGFPHISTPSFWASQARQLNAPAFPRLTTLAKDLLPVKTITGPEKFPCNGHGTLTDWWAWGRIFVEMWKMLPKT